jgi:hypothetical protein
MGFEPVKRRGRYWGDVKELNELIYKFPYSYNWKK